LRPQSESYGQVTARLGWMGSWDREGRRLGAYAHGPCHVAAAVPWYLAGSDGHGAARVEDEEADRGNVPSDVMVTALLRFDVQLQFMSFANGESTIPVRCGSNQVRASNETETAAQATAAQAIPLALPRSRSLPSPAAPPQDDNQPFAASKAALSSDRAARTLLAQLGGPGRLSPLRRRGGGVEGTAPGPDPSLESLDSPAPSACGGG
jgi:hypothetical protein